MDKNLQQCLENKEFDYIMPFLWLKGDCREALYQEILAIKQSGCNSFCAARFFTEISRPRLSASFLLRRRLSAI